MAMYFLASTRIKDSGRPSLPWQILMIKRAVNPHDRWSGDIALPGERNGHRCLFTVVW